MKSPSGTLTILLRQDIRFQGEQGIYPLYLLIGALYILLLRLIPLRAREITATILLLSDPTVLGFFFSGVILFTERELLPTLFVTPLRVEIYLLSRILSFLGLSLLLCLMIVLPNFSPDLRLLWILPGLALSAPFFTLAGMTLAMRFKDVLVFLIFGGLMMTLFFLPFFELLPRWSVPVYLPTRSSLQFFRLALDRAGTKGYPLSDLIFTGVVSLAETAGLFLLCRKNIRELLGGKKFYG